MINWLCKWWYGGKPGKDGLNTEALANDVLVPLEKNFLVFLPCKVLALVDPSWPNKRDFRIELDGFTYQDEMAIDYLWYKSGERYHSYCDEFVEGVGWTFKISTLPAEEFDAFHWAVFYGEDDEIYLTGLPQGNFFVQIPKRSLDGLEQYYQNEEGVFQWIRT